MSQMDRFEELQGKIGRSLDRIGQRLDAMQKGAAQDEEYENQRKELEREKLSNSELRGKIVDLESRFDKLNEELEAARNIRSESMVRLDGEFQSLRAANERLRDNNRVMREAIASGSASVDMINEAVMAEMEGLKAVREADIAEMEAIKSELASIIGQN
ncbi:MAG: hypothetical protein OXD29_13695 [Roseovarius sp.]|nr:hypothetical protein [Roseovarius sp.]MCY4208983.1 hypothetical protein [Roseovarius sp.]MCY4290470.1 hypothetical protein [Roseovarius sp.]MCY4315506.1 hypothetical protein [Roseovarius sp.]